eukprot:1667659-Pyramimonas_sp.AAC.1
MGGVRERGGGGGGRPAVAVVVHSRVPHSRLPRLRALLPHTAPPICQGVSTPRAPRGDCSPATSRPHASLKSRASTRRRRLVTKPKSRRPKLPPTIARQSTFVDSRPHTKSTIYQSMISIPEYSPRIFTSTPGLARGGGAPIPAVRRVRGDGRPVDESPHLGSSDR